LVAVVAMKTIARERGILRMVRKKDWFWMVMVTILLLIFFSGCESLKKKQALTPEQERAAQVEKEKAAQQEKEKKDFEAGLAQKKYPGIEGEVWESTLLKDIHFQFDQYDLTEEARKLLTENARVLSNHPSLKIQIEGHCDERGNSQYNLALGEKRAMSAKLYLVKLGVQENRLSTISYGKEMPVDPGHTEEAWAKNRRCHFVILSR
jgi:peptidoglycan-associated lipoprotein